jgi:vitamin B12 transporter
VRGAASKHVRFPDIRQLYDATSGVNSLKVETALNKELGVDHKFSPDLRAGMTVFQNDVQNFIEKDDTTGLFTNYDHYRFVGTELTGNWAASSALNLAGSYTYMRSSNLSSGASYEDLQYRPSNRTTFEGDYRFGDGWRLNLSAIFVNGQYYFSRTTPTQEATLKNYRTVDVKLSKRLSKTVSTYLGVKNLFDEDYSSSYALPAPGRFVFVGLDYQI